MNKHNEEYVLSRTSQEYQRLRVQAKLWEPMTARVLQQAGLAPGMSCLDLGCGPGEVMRLMGETVGPMGHVTGVDVDGKVGNEGLGILQETTDSQFAFIETDIEATDELPGAPFDMIFTRLTLIHLDDPVAALRKMMRWTKPGGVVVVQDFDFRAWGTYPPHEAMNEAIQVASTVMEKSGLDPQMGFKLPTYFMDAGLGAPDGTDVSGLLSGFDVVGRMTQAVYNNVFPFAQKMGLADEAQRESIFASIEEAIEAGTHTASSPLLVGAWKQTPV
ncbi:MAG: methyltransferase domain-containing protein [Chloroflexota bacterium]